MISNKPDFRHRCGESRFVGYKKIHANQRFVKSVSAFCPTWLRADLPGGYGSKRLAFFSFLCHSFFLTVGNIIIFVPPPI